MSKHDSDYGLDDCTHYEGKNGYALVDWAWLDSLIAENDRLRAEVERIKNKKCPHDLAREWSKNTTPR